MKSLQLRGRRQIVEPRKYCLVRVIVLFDVCFLYLFCFSQVGILVKFPTYSSSSWFGFGVVVRGEVVDWVFVSFGSMSKLPLGVPLCGHSSLFPHWHSLRTGGSIFVRESPLQELGRWTAGGACAWRGELLSGSGFLGLSFKTRNFDRKPAQKKKKKKKKTENKPNKTKEGAASTRIWLLSISTRYR